MKHHAVGPYGRLAAFVLGHRRAVALATAVLTVVLALLGLPPAVDSNLLALLPDREPAVESLRALHQEEGGFNLVSLAFDGEDPVAVDAYVEALVPRLEALPALDFALHEVDEALALRIGLLQLAPEDVGELTVRLQGALALGPALNPIVVQRLLDMGPVTERIAAADQGLGLADAPGHALVLARPSGSSMDPAFATRVMAEIEEVLARHPPPEGVALTWKGGAYHNNVEGMRGVRRDILRTSLASAVLVLTVITVTFRSGRAALLVFTPLVVANVINLSLLGLWVGAVNTYTSFGTAVLIGLGIDFAVHLVGRYREERAGGVAVEPAIVRAWDRTGPPCATAAVTSSAGFAALGAAQFKGFSQLGLVLGVGLIVSLLAMLVLLPLLLPILDRRPPQLLGARIRRGASRSTYRLAPLGLMVLVVLTGTLGLARLPLLEFEYDTSALWQDGLGYAELTAEQRALAQDSYAPVIVSLPDARSLTETHRRVEAEVEAGRVPHVGRVASLESVLPADQDRRRATLEALASLVRGADTPGCVPLPRPEEGDEVCVHPNLRYLPPPFVSQLLPLADWDGEALTRDALPEGLLGLLGARDPDRHRLLLFPRGNMWDLREAHALLEQVEDLVPDRPVAGEFIATGALYRVINRDMPLVGLLAFLMVAVVVSIDLKRPVRVLLAVGTLVTGLVWTGAALEAVGVRLSLLNVVGIPILIGIGIDVIIHLMHRLREEGPGGVRRALSTTGVAAAISTLTTILSFCSLFLAGTRGVRDLGALVVIGLVAVFFAGATLMPVAWAAGWRMTGQAPGDHRRRADRL